MTIPADLADQTANESQAKKQLNLDESKPVTTLQIRLADGTSVKVQLNLTHTINDLRQYIITYPFSNNIHINIQVSILLNIYYSLVNYILV